MKLGEALSLLKKEKSRLARLILLRKANVYADEGKKPEFNPEKLTEEINQKLEEIRKLKINIQKTNLAKEIGEEKISIAEAIIKVGDLRSQIAQLSDLFEGHKRSLYFEREQKIPQVAHLSETEIEEEIERLEIFKTKLDNLLQIANWNVELISKTP